MTNPLQDLVDLKDRVASVSSQLERSKGRLDSLRERLFKEFQVKTEDKAKLLLEKLTKELANKEEALEEAKQAFQEKWGEKLES